MDPVISDILTTLKAKHNLTKFEIERIIDSQFKVLQLAIENRDLREINMMYLGKFKPSNWLKKNIDDVLEIKARRDCKRMVQPLNQQSGSEANS